MALAYFGISSRCIVRNKAIWRLISGAHGAGLALFLHTPLEALALSKLALGNPIPLSASSQMALPGVKFILRCDLGIFTSDPGPETARAFPKAGGRFPLPSELMGFIHGFAISSLTLDQRSALKFDGRTLALVGLLDLAFEPPKSRTHYSCNPFVALLHGMQGL